MKILIVSDEECPGLWDYGTREKLRPYDLILSCGDLSSSYLSYLVTLARCPLLYVHGNHDVGYRMNPPEGCDCIDDHFVTYNGIRILGLGGCRRYRPGEYQYTESQMRRRIRRLRWQLWRHKGVDIVVTHAPPKDLGDDTDPAHWGFTALRELLDKYQPAYLLHGHVHMRYGSREREISYGNTTIINTSECFELEIPDQEVKQKEKNILIYRTRYKDPYDN